MLTVLEKFLRGFYSIKHRIAGWRKSSPCTKYMLFTEVWIQVFTDTTRYLGLWFPLNILCINQWYVLCYCYICRCSLLLWFISFLFFLSFHSCAGRVQMFFLVISPPILPSSIPIYLSTVEREIQLLNLILLLGLLVRYTSL